MPRSTDQSSKTGDYLIEWDGGWITADSIAEAEDLIAEKLTEWKANGDPGHRDDFTIKANVDPADPNQVHVAHLTREKDVILDGEALGRVRRHPTFVPAAWVAELTDGTVLSDNNYGQSGAIGELVRHRLDVGDRFKITGLASATGGPWTIA